MLRHFTEREGGEGRALNKAGSEIVERRGWRKRNIGMGRGGGEGRDGAGNPAGEDPGSLGSRRRKAGKQGEGRRAGPLLIRLLGTQKNPLGDSSPPGKASRERDEGSSCRVWEVSLTFRI